MANIVSRIEPQTEGIPLFDSPGYYFGYGLESVPEVMDAILGHEVTAEIGVIAVRKQLFVQEIDQVPDVPTVALGGKSPQQILAETWTKHSDLAFSSYVLRSTDNRSDTVSGTLYEVDIEDAEKLRKWDLALPPIDNPDPATRARQPFVSLGWRDWAPVELTDGRKADTLTIYLDQPVDRVVQGMDYDPFLNPKDITLKVIREAMEQ